jgi:tetratricopeptide (TPR) repeat protein
LPAELSEFKSMLQRGRELQASGRHNESRRHFEKVLRTAQAMGPPNESVALEWLGSTYFELRRLAEAQRALIRCLELRNQIWGSRNQSDPHHARILTSLGGVESALHRFRQAEDRFDEALKIWRSVPGAQQSAEFGAYLNNVAMLNYAQGRYSDAVRHLGEVVALWRNSVASDDRRLVQAKSNLAGVLSRLGFHDEADRLSSEALAAFSGKLEQEPIVAAELLSIRSSVLRKAKRKREAQAVEALARDFLRRSELHHRVDVSQLGGP